MDSLTVFYEAGSVVMAPSGPAFQVEFDHKAKLLLIRARGLLTDESLVALYKTSRKFSSAASFNIVDFSCVSEFAVSGEFIRALAYQKPPLTETRSLSVIVAPQAHVFGLCRMFQLLGEAIWPLLQIVHTLEEAFAAMGIQRPQFLPSVARA